MRHFVALLTFHYIYLPLCVKVKPTAHIRSTQRSGASQPEGRLDVMVPAAQVCHVNEVQPFNKLAPLSLQWLFYFGLVNPDIAGNCRALVVGNLESCIYTHLGILKAPNCSWAKNDIKKCTHEKVEN